MEGKKFYFNISGRLITDIKENIKTFEVVKGTLDDVFVNVVGEQNV